MPAAAGAFSWNLPATTISPESEDSGFPQVAVAPDGTTTVVWLRSSDATVYVATRPAGQTVFGPPQLLSDPFGTDELPRVAVSPDGTTTVIWRNTGADVIQAVMRPPGSATFGPIEVISEPGLQAFSPELVSGGDGSVTAIWEARDFVPAPPYATYSQVKAAVRLPGESAFGLTQNVSERGAFSGPCPTLPQVAAAPEGTTTAVWSLVDVSGDCVIQSATRAAGQASFPSPSTTPPDVLSAPGEEGDFPQVAVGRNQEATAVWDNATISRIESATRTAGAVSFDDPVVISDENGIDPQVALAPDGRATAIWVSNALNSIDGATRPAGSSVWGGVTRVSILDDSSTAQYFPKLAVANDGRATVVWTNLVTAGGNRIGTLSTTRAPGSSDWSPAEMLGPDVGPSSYPFPIPDLAVGADGRATAVWNANRDGRLVIQAVSSTTIEPPPATKRLSVAKSAAGNAQGVVTSSPSGINCGGTCEARFQVDTLVRLTATPDPGSRFTGWSGACTNQTGACWVQMSRTRSVTAGFAALETHRLTVSRQGTGQGTITSNPSGIDCGTTCEASWEDGTQVTLNASAAQGSQFTGWSGACTGTAPCQVTMDQARQVTATFTAPKPPFSDVVIRLNTTRPAKVPPSQVVEAVRVSCEGDAPCRIDSASARAKAGKGKAGKAQTGFPFGEFPAGTSRIIEVKIPASVYDKLKKGKKSGTLTVNVRAQGTEGPRDAEIKVGLER